MDFKLLLNTCNTRVIFSQFHHRYILCKFNNQTDSLPDGSPIKQFHTDWTNELTFADLIEVNMLCPSQATREVTCASLFFSYLLSLSISSVLNRLWHLHGCRVRRLNTTVHGLQLVHALCTNLLVKGAVLRTLT